MGTSPNRDPPVDEVYVPRNGFSSLELLMSGAMSGVAAKTCIAPMDRVKILFQTDPKSKFTMSSVLALSRTIWKDSGIRGFWRGHTATIIRIAPYSATNYFVFDRMRTIIGNHPDMRINPIGLHFIAGSMAGSAAVCVTYPLETVRARLAVDLHNRYSRGYMAAFRDIIASEGVRTLYSGLKPTLLGIIPYSGISFTVYETLKRDNAGVFTRFAMGALAGFSAQAATYPLDVVRRRMQVAPEIYPDFLSTFRKIYANEGVYRGLYKGLSMNAIKGPMAVAISLNTNDHIKQFFQNSHR